MLLLRPGAEPAVARPSQTPGPGHYVAKVLITADFEDKMSWMSGETISLFEAKVMILGLPVQEKISNPFCVTWARVWLEIILSSKLSFLPSSLKPLHRLSYKTSL